MFLSHSFVQYISWDAKYFESFFESYEHSNKPLVTFFSEELTNILFSFCNRWYLMLVQAQVYFSNFGICLRQSHCMNSLPCQLDTGSTRTPRPPPRSPCMLVSNRMTNNEILLLKYRHASTVVASQELQYSNKVVIFFRYFVVFCYSIWSKESVRC